MMKQKGFEFIIKYFRSDQSQVQRICSVCFTV